MLFRTCVIVASDERQAAQMRARLAARLAAGIYPRELELLVLADPERGRVGSGGGALRAAVQARDRLERGEPVLVINAGGESRRLPVYGPEGKLFAPIPLPSSSQIPPVVLDLQLGLFLRYPWNEGELVMVSGDVAFDLGTDPVPEVRGDIYGLSTPASFELGSRHGVFRTEGNAHKVVDFFQKESVDFLRRHAALEDSPACAIDAGIIGLSAAGVRSLYQLAEAPMPGGGTFLTRLCEGRDGFDLYFELLTACVPGQSLERYLERVSPRSPLDARTLETIHAVFRDVDFRAHLMPQSRFLHFGSLREYPSSCAELLSAGVLPFYAGDAGAAAELRPAVDQSVIQINSIETRCITEEGAWDVYIESCRGAQVRTRGGPNLLVGLTDRKLDSPLPPGICLDERGTPRGRFLLVYSVEDSWPRQSDPGALRFCGIPLAQWLADRDLSPRDIFTDGEKGTGATTFDLLDARLFVADAGESFAEAYWRPELADADWHERFKAGPRASIREIAAGEQLGDREERRCAIRQRLLREAIEAGQGWVSISEWDLRRAFEGADPGILLSRLSSTADELLRAYRSRLLRSFAIKGRRPPEEVGIRIEYLDGRTQPPPLRRAVRADQTVRARAPVRVDIAGGWTDTPPFTLREGGEVVNVAVDLDGQPPIQVSCRPTREPAIRIHSIDQGVREKLNNFAALEDFRDPRSPFALPKAALHLLGLQGSRRPGETLTSLLARTGCGLELSLLSALPKGSGLGGSSILGAAIMAALQRFFGLSVSRDELVLQVLQMEQSITTGGGWQDQVGGVAGGVKYIASLPGLKPDPVIHPLDPYLFQEPAAANRFTLYDTGIARLAKDILQGVVDRVNTMEPAYLFTLRSLKQLARHAREAIRRRDLAVLGRVLGRSWEANKLIHESTTNNDVEELLGAVSGDYTAMKLLGAGGGGFILFLSDSVETAAALRERLTSIGSDRARVVDMSPNLEGLQVTVS